MSRRNIKVDTEEWELFKRTVSNVTGPHTMTHTQKDLVFSFIAGVDAQLHAQTCSVCGKRGLYLFKPGVLNAYLGERRACEEHKQQVQDMYYGAVDKAKRS